MNHMPTRWTLLTTLAVLSTACSSAPSAASPARAQAAQPPELAGPNPTSEVEPDTIIVEHSPGQREADSSVDEPATLVESGAKVNSDATGDTPATNPDEEQPKKEDTEAACGDSSCD